MTITPSIGHNITFNVAYGYMRPPRNIPSKQKYNFNKLQLIKFLGCIPLVNIIAAAIMLNQLNSEFTGKDKDNPVYKALLSRIIITFIPGVSSLLVPVDILTHAVVRPVLNCQLKQIGAPSFSKLFDQAR